MESQKKTAMEALRRTGRTTRMIERAIEIFESGLSVCVIVKTHDANRTLARIHRLVGPDVRGEKNFIAVTHEEHFDWEAMRVRGYSEDVVHLIDHWVIESRYRRIIEKLHEFDPPAVVMVPDQSTAFTVGPVLPEEKPASQTNHSGAKYFRKIKLIDGKADVYAVANAFDVKCPARVHAIKKLLLSGLRGKGETMQDLSEARDAVTRAIQLEAN